MKRMDKRADPWADFLRRILITASLASAAAVPASAEDATPPAEVAEVEPPPPAKPATKA